MKWKHDKEKSYQIAHELIKEDGAYLLIEYMGYDSTKNHIAELALFDCSFILKSKTR